jgi:hypothetical protein
MYLCRLPGQTPPLAQILDDIGNPSPAAVAAALDVHPRTVSRWLAADDAPRVACLALWWLTRWGFSTMDAELWNTAQMAFAERDAWRDEASGLHRELARVVAAGQFGCANDPTQRAALVSVAPPARRQAG